jgi:hypothetical protein
MKFQQVPLICNLVAHESISRDDCDPSFGKG